MANVAKGDPASASAKDGSHGVQSAEVVLEVLSAFIGAEPMPMLKTLAERTGMHPAKIHRYLVSLVRTGYVEQDASSSRYRLGPAALRLAFAALSAIDSIRVTRPLMAEFCHRLGYTVVLAVWKAGGPMIAIKETSPGLLTITATEGYLLPVLRSSIGNAFGAWLPREKTEKIIASELEELAAHPQSDSPTSLGAVDTLFAEVRRRGIARTTGQLSASTHSFAAPVFDASGDITAVLCAVGPAGQFDSRWISPLARTLVDCASEVSVRLGYIGR